MSEEYVYPTSTFEDPIWSPKSQDYVCKMTKYGVNIMDYPVRYQPIVLHGDCDNYKQMLEEWKAIQAVPVIAQATVDKK